MSQFKRHRNPWHDMLVIALAVSIITLSAERVLALITGGEGNAPHADPGWPAGAAVIFNNPARIAWWEGPPFGGGQWHAECRGDAAALSGVLADFAKLDVKRKRVILHDGTGHSFWLNPNRVPAKEGAANVDWVFMIWQPANWDQLRKLPIELNPTDGKDAEQGPPSQIDVYTGGNVHWSEVAVPNGIEIDDQRLEAHGFKLADGRVLEGTVTDLGTERPVAAQISLQRVEPQPKGGYLYPVVAETTADAQGHWLLKNAPTGSMRVVVAADGYVTRVVGYASIDEQPAWQSYRCGLAQPAPVSGRVTDDSGNPLADAEVRLDNVATQSDGRYESPDGYKCQSNGEGNFRLDAVPLGKASVWVHKSGYCRPGMGQSISTPAADVTMKMMKSASLTVTVDFGGVFRPAGYIVQLTPEGGEAVGKWSGSGNIDAKNQISFADVPPGKYQLQGHPNPSRAGDGTGPFGIELTGGPAEITLVAK